MRLVVITVSTFGAIGTSGRALLSELGRRSAQRVPSSFHPEVSWAAPPKERYSILGISWGFWAPKIRLLDSEEYRYYIVCVSPKTVHVLIW